MSNVVTVSSEELAKMLGENTEYDRFRNTLKQRQFGEKNTLSPVYEERKNCDGEKDSLTKTGQIGGQNLSMLIRLKIPRIMLKRWASVERVLSLKVFFS